MSLTSIFLAHAYLFIIFLLLNHITIVQSDAKLISQICRRTPNYKLCVSSLCSDPRSSTADVAGLALIMVGVVKAKASTMPQLIKQQMKKSPELKQALESCGSYYYDGILTADVPVAMEAVQKGDPKFGETSMNDAAIEADRCEAEFKGKSPFTNMNKLVHDTSVIAAAIIRNLL